MELIIPELDFEPSQKLLLQMMQSFMKLEKLDLKTHQFRCFLGPQTRHDIVIKELCAFNSHVWPLVPSPHVAKRQGYIKFIHPKSSINEVEKIAGGIVCLTAATERYPEKFLYKLLEFQPSALFHLGG